MAVSFKEVVFKKSGFFVRLIIFGLILIAAGLYSLKRGATDNKPVPLSDCVNADYAVHAFVPYARMEGEQFKGLEARTYFEGGIPYVIRPPHEKGGEYSVITTGSDPYFSCTLPLIKHKSKALHFAVSSAWLLEDHSRIARLAVRYRDGTIQKKILVANEDVGYHETPTRKILWQNKTGEKIMTLDLPLEHGKVPEALEFNAMPAQGINGRQPAVSIFALTQEVYASGKKS